MGLGAAMEIGKNGLTVYRVASEVTSENIANVNTPGYSRQRVILETAPPTTANGFPLGTGVKIATVERYYDGLLQQQIVTAQTTQGYDTTKSNILQQIEPAFNEVSNDGIGAAISKFFGAWQDLTVNPTGTAERQSVITNAQILSDNFHTISKTLSDTISAQNTSLVPLVNSINATLKDIAQLNGQIKTTELVAGNANEMRDQRDQLIRELSQKIGIKFTENTDGTTDVYVTDNSASPATKLFLVKGDVAGQVNANTTDPNKTIITVTDNSTALPTTSNPLDPTVALPTIPFYKNDIEGGQLWAALKLRDVILPGYLAKVDALAATITSEVNLQHINNPPATNSYDLNGNAGIALFDPAGTTAALFNLNVAIGNNTSLIAASSNSLLTGDNQNALKMANLQSKLSMSTGTLSFNGYLDGLVSQIGLDVKSSKTTVSQDEAFSNQLISLRESNSGVSLDEELTNLVKYQRSYQASAKLITTATEMLDTLMGIIR
jgi:flagellar hook-associated protein 1 FlgK